MRKVNFAPTKLTRISLSELGLILIEDLKSSAAAWGAKKGGDGDEGEGSVGSRERKMEKVLKGERSKLTNHMSSQQKYSSIRLNSTLTSPKLFVSGLSRYTSDENLKKAFEQFGSLVEAKVITDRATGRSKGFGFVTYETIEEAEKAREGMNAKFLDGWVIFVDPAKTSMPRPPPPPPQDPLNFGITTNKTIGWTGR
ncbi:hypothetical protein HAX54_022767 [Datura stramonium]|uniref:RRM domain-containing protein n=1 Tax=Datura stramonium TaxID=4076 RepID=A0ABS8S4B9_DATST|nr:hypothetical protein [Datura stramonium]